ncbi:DUF305 domain-containing protein [Advenella kashmirensis]|nr:DUF305 domain-containing protein [Advenella kashmirensis]
MHQHPLPCFARTFVARGLVVAALAVSGFAMPMAAHAQAGGHAHMNTGDAPKDMHASMMNMQQQMDAVKASGDTDYDFAVMMRIHHQGAVDMRKWNWIKAKTRNCRPWPKRSLLLRKKKSLSLINGLSNTRNKRNKAAGFCLPCPVLAGHASAGLAAQSIVCEAAGALPSFCA